MVKNSIGGNRAKSQARKFSSGYDGGMAALRLSQSDEEIYAVVTKLYGQGRCQIYTVAGAEMQCVIRSKFRGRNKRNNMVAVGTVVLVGIRDWASVDTAKTQTTDLLEVYSSEEMNRLANIPSTQVHVLVRYVQTMTGVSGGTAGVSADHLVFSHEDADDDFGSSTALLKPRATAQLPDTLNETDDIGGDMDICIDDI
jgi:translation initiation factor IF-1